MCLAKSKYGINSSCVNRTKSRCAINSNYGKHYKNLLLLLGYKGSEK